MATTNKNYSHLLMLSVPFPIKITARFTQSTLEFAPFFLEIYATLQATCESVSLPTLDPTWNCHALGYLRPSARIASRDRPLWILHGRTRGVERTLTFWQYLCWTRNSLDAILRLPYRFPPTVLGPDTQKSQQCDAIKYKNYTNIIFTWTKSVISKNCFVVTA